MFMDSLRAGGSIRGPLSLYPRTVTEVPVTITGVAGQTADLFVVKNSAGVDLFTVQADGDVTVLGDVISVDEIGGANMDLTGHLTVGDYMSVVGAASLSSTLSVAGAAAFASSVSVGGPAVFSGETQFSSYVSLNPSGALYIGQRSSDCPAKDNQGSLYVKDSSGTAELFYRDDTGSVVQLTSGGTIDAADRALSNLANGFSIILPSTSTAGIALYNTADQVTNYEKGVINWASNVFKISTSEGGSGTVRALTLEVPRSGAPAIVTTYTLQRENAIPFHQLSWTATTTANNVGVDIGGSIGGEATKALNVSTAFTSNSATAVTGISIAPTVAQSGTAGYYGLSINPTETTVGSGVKRLISAQVSSVDKFTVSNDGHTAISGVAVGPMLTVTSSATAYTNGGGTVELGRTGNLSMVNGESFNSVKILPAFTVAAPATGSAQFNGLVIDLSGVTHDVSAGGAMNSSGLKIVGGASTSGSFNYGLEVSAASSIFTGTSGSRSALSVVNNSLTTSYGLSVTSSSSSLTSGSVLRTSKTGTSGTTAFTGSVADVSWTHNHNAAATLDHTANALDVSRAITSNHASAAITVSGALADLNSTNVQTLGTLTDTGNILKLTQGYASASGDVISIANSGTGKDISGTGSTWSVSKIGAAVLTALTVNSVTVIDTSGNLSSANGVASFTGSPSSITVTNGIVTAIS